MKKAHVIRQEVGQIPEVLGDQDLPRGFQGPLQCLEKGDTFVAVANLVRREGEEDLIGGIVGQGDVRGADGPRAGEGPAGPCARRMEASVCLAGS